MSAPVSPPPGEPPLAMLPPDAPATVEDVRASRRWTWVALAWAIAASAIAVIALLSANGNDNSNNPPAQTTPDPTPRIERFEKQTNDRLDAFSRRLNDTASTDDVKKLERRLAKAEGDSAAAKTAAAEQGKTIEQQQADIDDLKKRVDDLEKKQQQHQDQGTTTTP